MTAVTVGLSRRRAPAASFLSVDNEDHPKSTQTSSPPSPSENGTTTHTLAAGSAVAGGSRVAFDPRDLAMEAGEDARVGGKLPWLTLMEEVLLLGIKDKQAYLSFWTICAARKRSPLPDRAITVLSMRQTGETLDETLKQTEDAGEKMGVGTWVDLLSGETWNLKQVRERLANGLVDKGVLRTEKRNFLSFDMATHPVADAHVKAGVINRVVALLTSGTSAVPPAALDAEGMQWRTMRAVCLVSAASVLDNAFGRLGYEEREAAFGRSAVVVAVGGTESKRKTRIATGSAGIDLVYETSAWPLQVHLLRLQVPRFVVDVPATELLKLQACRYRRP
ncbi:Golgi phosphoprotein 3-domain-containing protein [Mycena amicta]|nr:Golgi phosphoprotein 3-domain-containing protein [Mycena amicta]